MGPLACTVQWVGLMPVIEGLLRRWGFVKLSRYGLVLTPEDRVMSTGPQVLDDGLGGRVVGWQTDDLAALELKPWGERQAPRAVEPIVMRPFAPAPAPAPALAPAAAPVLALVTPPAPTPEPVAARAQVEEDDWEWEISLARARAAAEEVEVAARAFTAPVQVRPATAAQVSPARPVTRARPAAAPVASSAAPVRPTPAPARPTPAPARPTPSPARPVEAAISQARLAAARAPVARPAADPASSARAPAAPVSPARPAATPVPTERPAISPSEVASKVRPVVGPKPAPSAPPSTRGVKTLPLATIVPDGSDGDYGALSVALSVAPSIEAPRARSAVRTRPMMHAARAAQETMQVTAAVPPRRWARGTNPVTPTRPGMPAVRPRASADDPTATDIVLADRTATDVALDDHTTPNLPLLERTQPGIALPSVRGRLAR